MLTEAEELASFDFLASYAPNRAATGPESLSAPHEHERDAKWQRRDNNKGAPGKGRGVPKRDREEFGQFNPGPHRGHQRDFQSHFRSRGGGGGSGGGDGELGEQYEPRDSWHAWTSYASPSELAQLRGQVQMLQKIVLRHEDALCLMRQEVAFVVHFRIGVDASLVHDIYKSQLGWRELRKTQPAKITTTLRNTLMECVLKVLLHRIQKLEDQDQQEVRDRLTKAGWLDSGSSSWTWAYLSWDAAQRTQVVNKDRSPLAHSEVKAALTSLLEGVKKPDSVTRFHPLRPVTNSMSGESVAFALQYPFRGEFARSLYEATVQLSNSSATQLIAAQIRVDRGQRSGLANAIARQS